MPGPVIFSTELSSKFMSFSFPALPFKIARNKHETPDADYGDRQSVVINAEGLIEARRCISAWPGYAATPLINLPGLARELGINRLFYKQAGDRFGLRSFKPLGGAYAVQRCLMREVATTMGLHSVASEEIGLRKYADVVSNLTVTAATDGNHGRSVAWGAQMFGCHCVIFINEAVTQAREKAIAEYGAEVRRHPGSYDDAVREAFETAKREGWHVIPDTTDGDIIDAPRDVTQGYAVMAAEVIEQLPNDVLPTHTFLQAGVGGMAAAVCGQFWQEFSRNRPKSILVEPEQSACWFASLANGQPTTIGGDLDSFMAGLACGEISTLAWEILEPGAFAAMTLKDDVARSVMCLLASGHNGDQPIVAGESGVAGLAGLITAALDEQARHTLGLDENSCVIVFGSEGATDEELYKQVVGKSWQEIAP